MSDTLTAPKNLALLGYGNMGQLVERLAPEFGFAVTLKLDEFNNVDGEGITSKYFQNVDVAVDFSIPSAVCKNSERVSQLGINLVVGTTGWLEELPRVRAAVENNKTGLVYGANFSIGVQAFYGIVAAAAEILADEDSYDAWAYEIHHKMKKDVPSGTLLHLRELVEQAGYNRQIDVASSRAGAIPGTHEIGFDSEADTIRLVHSARSRVGFARGALRAARWILGKTGVYEFSSVWHDMR